MTPFEALSTCLSHPLGWPAIPLLLPLAMIERTSEAVSKDPDEDLTPREKSILSWLRMKEADGRYVWFKSQRSEVIRQANEARLRELEERAKEPLTKIHI